jgi:amino acid adenylation domain-containing protein
LALCADDRSMTYAELEARSNRLAHRLRRLGLGPGRFVALFLERAPEMIVAILGTLKAGAAYVPLDPSAPAGRLRRLLAETGAPVVLVQHALRHRLPECGAAVLCVDDPVPDGDLDDDDALPPRSGVRGEDLAYVISTSGSTGQPRGVMVEHRAIVNTVAWRDLDLTVRADDRVLFNLSYAFDPSLCLIFPTLAAGARMVVAPPGEEYDPHRLLERVVREGVTILEASPAVLRLMVDDPLLRECRTLRWVCCGGEAMPRDLPGRLLGALDVTLYNLYGPTEAAVDSTWWACRRDDPRPAVPIGRPIANVRAYVLDAGMRPVPPGVPGELYLGGAGLARGYRNDPATTAGRFVPDPFAATPGARLYRTGDRCRWLDDGALDFLGRLDDQVKVRGFRIEPGEVEAALRDHPDVRDAVVTPQADVRDGQVRLIAHLVGRGENTVLTPQALRRHLKETLPDYMVPAAFVVVSALPRTAGGKLDRRALALAAPPGERPATDRPYLPPRTPLEEFLAGLWCEVLHLDRVGALDHFFELGGNSIQGAMLVNRLQQRLGEQVYVVALFDSPTIAGLADYLGRAFPEAVRRHFGPESLADAPPGAPERAHRPGRSRLVVPLQPGGSLPPWFMVHPPGGIVVCYQALAHRLGRDRPFHGIRSRGLDGEEELPGRIEDMAADYLAAVREIQPRGPYLLGGWSAGGLVALEMARQLLAQGESPAILALLDTTPPVPSSAGAEEQRRSAREYGLDLSFEELARLGPDEQLPYLWQHALRLGLIGPEVPRDVARQVLDELKRLFHHHMVLANEYVVRPYPGRITLFRPSEAPVAAAVAVAAPRDRGWGSLAAAVDVRTVPGHHHSMVKEPHVQVLARTLNACLE